MTASVFQAIPKLFRMRDKSRKEFGPFYCRMKGDKKPLNLKTQDYFVARERAREAINGERAFTDSRYSDEAPKTETKVEAPNVSDDWTKDAVNAAGESVSFEYIPPEGPREDAKPSDVPKPDATKPADDTTQLPPELMEGLVKQLAQTLVELQIHGQEYLWLRIGKIQPGEVPVDSEARNIPTKIWESQVRKWIPTDVALPEWIVAPILVAFMAGTIQLEGARPLQKDAVKTP